MKLRMSTTTILLLLSAAYGYAQRTGGGVIDVAILFDVGRSGLTTGQNQFWMQGGSLDLSGAFCRGFGVAANISGTHSSSTGQGVPLSLVTATFGPRYNWSHGKARAFGEGLVGEGLGFKSVFPGRGGTIDSSNSIAIQAGGGVEVDLKHHWALRPIEAHWLRTQLPNSTTNVQNSVVLASGIALQWR